jgi:cytochrome c biogenesis protein CcmG, thiol:disulfide interchange protein DsbE
MMKIIVALVALLLYQGVTAAVVQSIEVGEPIPEFGLRTLSGEVVSRASLDGRPLLLVFWNTWNPPSRRVLPLINRLSRKFAQHGLTVLAITTGARDSESKTRTYWSRHHYPFPAGYDRYLDIGEAFGIDQTPTVLLVDAWGVVRYKSGRLPDDLDQHLQLLYSR